MDEQPVQLVKETRPPMAATKNRPRRVDYEYERAGTAAVFLFSEPLAGWRQATARARRTKVDWALEVAGLFARSGSIFASVEPRRCCECPSLGLVPYLPALTPGGQGCSWASQGCSVGVATSS